MAVLPLDGHGHLELRRREFPAPEHRVRGRHIVAWGQVVAAARLNEDAEVLRMPVDGREQPEHGLRAHEVTVFRRRRNEPIKLVTP